MLGILLFSSVVLLPQFLQTLVGYTAELAGLVLSGGGVVLLLAMPIVGYLTTKVQARYIIAFGWLCLALAMYYATKQIDLLISFNSAALLRVAQVVGVGFLFVPITLVSYVGMPVEKSNAIAGMINFMRNIGSSVGTSTVTTMIARRSQFHQSILVGHTTLGSHSFKNALDSLAGRLAQSGMNLRDAQVHAYARMYRGLQAQGTTLAYVDTYWVLAISATIMFALSFLLKKNDPRAGGEVAAA
jgi:MFS transporter, DHA2 family, multidrug resistance protein